jgi:glucokinase
VKTYYTGLVGDVGGTNARLALVDSEGHIRHPKTYAAKDYGSLSEVIATYLETTTGRKRPPRAVIAVAGPVVDGEIEFTNLDWRISEGELIGTFEFELARLINDFAAQAMAAPALSGDNLRAIGPSLKGAAGAPLVVCGAGTGFGVAGLVRFDRGDQAVASEGGHAAFAPTDALEAEVLAWLREKHGRVSIERVLSGPGLNDLYRALCAIKGQTPDLADEKAVLASAQAGGEGVAIEAIDMFCGVLGSVAGDLALTFGARGGAYLSGGIAPRMIDRLMSGSFRKRFEDKGRLSDYMADIPTFLIVHPYAALVGAARALAQMDGAPI